MKKFLLILNIVLFITVAGTFLRAEDNSTCQSGWSENLEAPIEDKYIPHDEGFRVISDDQVLSINPARLDSYEWQTFFSPETGVENQFAKNKKGLIRDHSIKDGALCDFFFFGGETILQGCGEFNIKMEYDEDLTVGVYLWDYNDPRVNVRCGYILWFKNGQMVLIRRNTGKSIPLRFNTTDKRIVDIRVLCYPDNNTSEWTFVFFVDNRILCAFKDAPPYGRLTLCHGKYFYIRYRGEIKTYENVNGQ